MLIRSFRVAFECVHCLCTYIAMAGGIGVEVGSAQLVRA